MFNVLFYPKYVPTAIHQRNHGMHLTRVTIINAHRPSPQTAACRSPTVLQLQQEVARPKARCKHTSPKKSGVDGETISCQHILISCFATRKFVKWLK